MSIQRRARRTDLREGALDVSLLFSNAQLDSEGKIILPQASSLQKWLVETIAFSSLTSTGTSPTYDYNFTLSSEIAQESQSDGASYLFKIYINGLKLSYSSDFTITATTCNLTLPYPLDSDDTIEIWYVESL